MLVQTDFYLFSFKIWCIHLIANVCVRDVCEMTQSAHALMQENVLNRKLCRRRRNGMKNRAYGGKGDARQYHARRVRLFVELCLRMDALLVDFHSLSVVYKWCLLLFGI